MNSSSFFQLSSSLLLLKEPELTDASAIQQIRSDKTVNQYLDRAAEITLKEAQQFIKKIKQNNKLNKSYYWGIYLQPSPQTCIGTICLWNLNRKKQVVEIGFELSPAYHRKGMMGDAVKLVIQFCTEQLPFKTITAFVNRKNTASVNLLLKNNFLPDKNKQFISETEALLYDCYYLPLN